MLGGDPAAPATGNRLLGELFGARVHQPGTDDWAALSQALEESSSACERRAARPSRSRWAAAPRSGALGFTARMGRAARAAARASGVRPGRDRARQLHRRHPRRPAGRRRRRRAAGRAGPPILAVEVAKEPGRDLAADARDLAAGALERLGLPGGEHVAGCSSSTTAGWDPAMRSPARRATRRSAGRPATAAGCWTAPTAARRSPALLGADADGPLRPAATPSSSGTPAANRRSSRPAAHRRPPPDLPCADLQATTPRTAMGREPGEGACPDG